MRSYRMYSLDEWGRIGFGHDIAAETDEEAVKLAREANPKAQKCEIWEGRRLVATFQNQVWELDAV